MPFESPLDRKQPEHLPNIKQSGDLISFGSPLTLS